MSRTGLRECAPGRVTAWRKWAVVLPQRRALAEAMHLVQLVLEDQKTSKKATNTTKEQQKVTQLVLYSYSEMELNVSAHRKSKQEVTNHVKTAPTESKEEPGTCQVNSTTKRYFKNTRSVLVRAFLGVRVGASALAFCVMQLQHTPSLHAPWRQLNLAQRAPRVVMASG